jgi:hypothetical protein
MSFVVVGLTHGYTVQYFKIYHSGYIRFLMAQKIVLYGAGFLGALPYHCGLSRASVLYAHVPSEVGAPQRLIVTFLSTAGVRAVAGVRCRMPLAVGPRESTSWLGVCLLSNRRERIRYCALRGEHVFSVNVREASRLVGAEIGPRNDYLGASGGSHHRVDARPFGGQRGGYVWKYPGEVERRGTRSRFARPYDEAHALYGVAHCHRRQLRCDFGFRQRM